jgi:hypothetical protein
MKSKGNNNKPVLKVVTTKTLQPPKRYHSTDVCLPAITWPHSNSFVRWEHHKQNERMPACRNRWSKNVLKAGLRGWLRLFQLGYEPDVQCREDKNEMKELMEQPEGLRSTAYIRMYCFELGYWSFCKFRFFVCRIYVCVMFSDCFTYASVKIGQLAIFNGSH